MPSTQKKYLPFLIFILCIALPLCIGGIGGLLTFQSVKTWYVTLNKPAFNPPNWIFGPVWTTLYILMGIASFLVWQKRKQTALYKTAVIIYLAQLILNLMWSYLFFYQHQIFWALLEIGLLLVMLVSNAIVFYKINKIAGWLYLPYILWVSFASYLTYSIYILN